MKIKLKKNEVLVWKRCMFKDLSSNNFRYPDKGIVKAGDWVENEKCGNGLHGWTLGFEDYFDPSLQGNMVLLIVNKNNGYVELDDKIKFKKGEVILNTSDLQKAHELILSVYPTAKLHWSVVNQSNESIANQGNNSIANQGDNSVAYQNDRSIANQGAKSVANQDAWSVANQGWDSVANQGSESVANQGWDSVAKQGRGSVTLFRGPNHIYRTTGNGVCIAFSSSYLRPKVFYPKPNETIVIKDYKIVAKYKTTPNKIVKLKGHEIFVFGSNLNGNHIGGAALFAKKEFGAEEGIGEGLTGRAYAFPTLDKNMKKVSEEDFTKSIKRLIKKACVNTQKIFLVTKVGCGIAGFSENEVKGYFREFQNKIPANVILPWIL